MGDCDFTIVAHDDVMLLVKALQRRCNRLARRSRRLHKLGNEWHASRCNKSLVNVCADFPRFDTVHREVFAVAATPSALTIAAVTLAVPHDADYGKVIRFENGRLRDLCEQRPGVIPR